MPEQEEPKSVASLVGLGLACKFYQPHARRGGVQPCDCLHLMIDQ